MLADPDKFGELQYLMSMYEKQMAEKKSGYYEILSGQPWYVSTTLTDEQMLPPVFTE